MAFDSQVVVNDCFALSFLSTLDRLKDCSVQTCWTAVIIAVTPGSPHTEKDIDSLPLRMQSSFLKETLERCHTQLRENRGAHRKQRGELKVWWRILTCNQWLNWGRLMCPRCDLRFRTIIAFYVKVNGVLKIFFCIYGAKLLDFYCDLNKDVCY